MNEEELEQALRKLRVQDVLLQTVVTLVSLAGRRLTVEEERDLDQAKRGIEAVRLLLPLCPEEQSKPVQDALSQLQMLYVRETRKPSPEEKSRAEARSRIWTPPGT